MQTFFNNNNIIIIYVALLAMTRNRNSDPLKILEEGQASRKRAFIPHVVKRSGGWGGQRTTDKVKFNVHS